MKKISLLFIILLLFGCERKYFNIEIKGNGYIQTFTNVYNVKIDDYNHLKFYGCTNGNESFYFYDGFSYNSLKITEVNK